MANLLKILGKIILSIVEYVLLLIILLAFSIRTTTFQTFLANKGAKYLSNKIGEKVNIEEIGISFFDRVYIDKLYIEDQKQDTLAYVHELFVNISDFNLEKLRFDIDEVGLSETTVKLKKYKGEEDLNFQFIIDAFETEDTEKETPPYEINVHNFEINETNFSFLDENQEKKEFGVDFTDMSLKNINLRANSIQIVPEKYKADITKFSFQEKSGFNLNQLATQAKFGNSGLYLEDAKLRTNDTRLNLPKLELVTQSISDYSEFVDSVLLNIDISNSEVSLYDVSLFAPQLEGMKDIVSIKGKTRNNVSALNIEDLVLRVGDETVIEGNFHLPDFAEFESEQLKQNIKRYNINLADIESIRMPKSMNSNYIDLPASLDEIRFFSGHELRIGGKIHDLTIDLHQMSTGIGNLNFTEAFRVVSDTAFNSFEITPLGNSKRPILVDDLNLAGLIGSGEIGLVNGSVGMKSFIFDQKGIRSRKISGIFERTEVMGYSYRYIYMNDVDYELDQRKSTNKNSVNGLIYVRDDNLDMTFNGALSVGEEFQVNAIVDLECAHLWMLHPSLEGRGEAYSSFKVYGSGKDMKTFNGQLEVDTVFYREGDESFSFDHLSAEMKRTEKEDIVDIKSDVIDAHLDGKVNLQKFSDNMMFQLSKVFPAFFPKQNEVTDLKSSFKYNIEVKRVNPILDIFVPQLQIADSTTIAGNYNGKANTFSLDLDSDYISYENTRLENISMMQQLMNKELLAFYTIDRIYLNDSLTFQEIHFTGIAADGFMDSQLIFHDVNDSRSNLEWYTYLYDKSGFEIELLSSYITINEHRWNLNADGNLRYTDGCLTVDDFRLERDEQYISANGQLSDFTSDHLNVDVMNLDLEDVSAFLGTETELKGVANVVGYIADPFGNLQFSGEAIVEDLFINETEVGDIGFGADYNAENELIELFGDIFYRGERTFAFKGNYYLEERDGEKLDMSLNFKNTDIKVVNEFLDPDVVSGIAGKLNGSLKVKGTLKKPELIGVIDFKDGKANLALLGADFFFDGKIESASDGIFINTMPITDEKGNTGFMTGTLLHDNFDNFNFELNFNLREHPFKRDPNDRSKPLKLDRFMVMKTEYSEDSPYYGTAFVTGNANISGYADNLSITVNAKTQRGTKINFPLYGPTTVEEEGYIYFKKPEGEGDIKEDKIDFTGIDLALNFDVTPDAQVRLIFDEEIGDEISARGEGDLGMTVDQYGDLALNGVYTLEDGVYNFVMGPYKQNFNIAKGGTIQWTGDPYGAYLDIEAYYKTNANLATVMPEVLSNRASGNQEILSYLKLQGEMLNPEISFDLEAPKATEQEKAVMARIRSDQDELNRQFFALLITKGFLPLSGKEGQGSGGSPFLDLAETQINSVLGKVSEDYRMNVNLESDEMSGQVSGEFGISKGFLNDRLIVSGSFGVGSSRGGEPSAQDGTSATGQNNIIGDVEVEYLLNESGTFRISAFNESNENSIVQQNNRGQFTQGIGVSYKEDFHTLEDFKLAQFIFNLFRKKENKRDVYEKEDNREPIPKEYLEKNAVKEEE